MKEELLEEEKRLRQLRFVVDFSFDYIKNQKLNHDEAIKILERLKKYALKLFPDKEEAFDIIYMPRFKRLLNSKFQRA